MALKQKNKTLTDKIFSTKVGDPSNSKTRFNQNKRKKQNKKDEEVDTENEKEDALCLRCLEPFSNNLPGAAWI